MKRQAPPLDAIEAFLIATRSRSFREAADRLALSPSAFSRRIQALEAFVGIPLIDRDGRRVILTQSGRRYLEAIEPAVDAVRQATLNLRAEHVGGPLRIMTPQSFAIAWLLPHLGGFMAAHPGTEPIISVGRDTAQLKKGNVDILITVHEPGDRQHEGEHLVDIEAIIVAAPQLAHGLEHPTALDRVHTYPLLGAYRPENMWQAWMAHVGHPLPPDVNETKFSAAFMVYEAAAAGLGLTLGTSLIVDRFLRDGRLRPVFDRRAPFGASYVIHYADDAVQRRADVRAFVTWIKHEIDKSKRDFGQLVAS